MLGKLGRVLCKQTSNGTANIIIINIYVITENKSKYEKGHVYKKLG